MRIEGGLYSAEYLGKLVGCYRRAIDGVYVGGVVGSRVEEILGEAPRALTVGAYGNRLERISEPCGELPTDLLVRY